MSFYLLDRPPARAQFLPYRRAAETGCVVIHTPEGGVDVDAPDLKAEQVADFIRTRSTPGSYHWIADSDSSVHMMPWTYEAAQDGTGSNKWAVGISIACDAAMWPKLLRDHPAWVDGALAQAALGACAYALDLHARTGIVIPARRIFRAESENGAAGFITHGDRDPGRRSDPGPSFPFARFLEIYAYFAQLNGLPVPSPGLPLVDPPPPTNPAPEVPEEDDDMPFVLHDSTTNVHYLATPGLCTLRPLTGFLGYMCVEDGGTNQFGYRKKSFPQATRSHVQGGWKVVEAS